MDKKKRIIKKGSLYLENGRIESLGKKVEAPRNIDHTIDAENKLILPGFVNVHSHLQQYFRGVYELIGDFYTVNLPLEGYRKPDDMETLGLASCSEFIYGGCTTSMVIYTYPDGFAQAVEKAGNRVILGGDIEEVNLDKLSKGIYEYISDKGESAFKRAIDLHKKWHGEVNGRITTVMAPKAPDLARPELYHKCKEYADEHRLKLTTHLSQSWREVKQVKKLYGETPPKHLHKIGILNQMLTGAHCTYTTESDIQLIMRSGMGILHCRAVTNPLLQWIELGIPVGLGTDDYFHDMLQLIRENIQGQKTRARMVGGAYGMLSSDSRTARPTFYEFIELATRKGAEVLGIDNEVGSLEVGKKADIIVVDMLNPYLTPTKDPLTSFVLYGTSSDVETVIVDGNILKKNGKLTTVDIRKALLEAQNRVNSIIDRFFDDYPNQKGIWEKKISS